MWSPVGTAMVLSLFIPAFFCWTENYCSFKTHSMFSDRWSNQCLKEGSWKQQLSCCPFPETLCFRFFKNPGLCLCSVSHSSDVDMSVLFQNSRGCKTILSSRRAGPCWHAEHALKRQRYDGDRINSGLCSVWSRSRISNFHGEPQRKARGEGTQEF